MGKRERVDMVLAGKTPDRAPVGLWYHFPQDIGAAEAADRHYQLYRDTDMD